MYASAWVTPLSQYQKMIDSGTLQGDDHQTRIIQKLQDLHDQLISYKPPQIPDAPNSNNLVTFQLNRYLANVLTSICSFLGYSAAMYLRPQRRLKQLRKASTFMAMSARAKRCLWTSFIRPFPLPSSASAECTSMRS